MTKVKEFNTDHIKTKEVAIAPIEKDARGWLGIATAAAGVAVAAAPSVQNAVMNNPTATGIVGIIMGLLQLFLNWQSKKGVESKNVKID